MLAPRPPPRDRRTVALSPVARHHFSRGAVVEVNPSQRPPQQPVVLHELLHVYQAFVLPDGPRNADVLKFFAVTGSLYLWGHVDRPPATRENLRARQPGYYAWLGELFGVQK